MEEPIYTINVTESIHQLIMAGFGKLPAEVSRIAMNQLEAAYKEGKAKKEKPEPEIPEE